MRDHIPTFDVKAQDGPFRYGQTKDGVHIPDGCHLVFTCPKCKKENLHGGEYKNKGAADGHRVSHCSCWPNGYYIKEI